MFRVEYCSSAYSLSGWIPSSYDSEPWIEISFEEETRITAIATQV